MAPLKTLCGLAVAVLILSGCGSTGSSSTSSNAMASSAPPSSSGGGSSTPPPSSGGSSGSTPPPSSGGSSGSTPPPPTGTAKLTWAAPTTNSDGSALTDLAGYHIHYGTTAASLSNTIDITSPSTLTYTVTSLSTGTWYFAVTAYTNTGVESQMSNVGSKTIT